KINLELCQDQERSFKLPGTATTNKKVRQEESAQRGIVVISEADAGEEDSDDEIDMGEVDEDEMIGGVSWADLSILCEDWDVDKIEAMGERLVLDRPPADAMDDHASKVGARPSKPE